MDSIVTPVLLAGGFGTRLWPLSRKSYPKQFSSLLGEESLFQQCAQRLTSSSTLEFTPPIIMTNAEFRFVVGEQLQSIGVEPGPILIEPEVRNTAPAILAASLVALQQNEEAILLVAPSDHVISDVGAFHSAIRKGLKHVSNGKIISFGVSPTRPETGYGYLETSETICDEAFEIIRFIEKPNVERAQKMLEAGNFLWNAGIFMFRAKDMLKAFELHEVDLIQPVQEALEGITPDLDFLRLDPDAWSKCEDISVDYAIMERVENLMAIPFSAGWSDLGGWDAVMDQMGRDKNGVAKSRNAHAIGCEDTLLRSESEYLELVGLGLKDIIAVAMPDAVLVAHRDRAQEVKTVIAQLKTDNIAQAESFRKDHRPWGWFETLAIRDRFQVKRILVKPGAALSLQSHHHRSEHWIVVEGTAKVTTGDQVKLITEGQSTYIPLGTIHRMENPGLIPMVLIEVQTGAYLGEDDIVRYEDRYQRV